AFQPPVRGRGGQRIVDLRAPLDDAVDELRGERAQVGLVGAEVAAAREGFEHVRQRLRGGEPRIEVHLIQRLQRCLARSPPGAHHFPFLRAPTFWKTLAISTAAIAASAPLLPAVVPARSTACSIVFVVSTPKVTATPRSCASSATRATPDAHSPATYSKCGVEPRITQPSAIAASKSPDSATWRSIAGISNAPGTRTTVKSSSFAPSRRRTSSAPVTRRSPMKSLKRDTTRTQRNPCADSWPSTVFIL